MEWKMPEQKYTFRLPIGDWSNDGHGKCYDYRIQSNKPVEAVREAYFTALEKTGLDLAEEVCSEYENSSITAEMSERLEKLGLPVPTDCGFVDEGEFVDLVLAYIKLGDPELELEVIPTPSEARLTFYGSDEKGRHIGHFGYGLFT